MRPNDGRMSRRLSTRMSAAAVGLAMVLASGVAAQSQVRAQVEDSGARAPADHDPESFHGIAAGGGLQFLSPPERDEALDDMVSLGAHWVRFDLNWADVQAAGSSAYDWQRYDALIDAVVERGLEPLVIIAYTPSWARPADCAEDKCGPARLKDYKRFVRKSVKRYADDGVDHWEIWNEPNLVSFWKPAPDIDRYATMLIRSSRAIHDVDADAVVLTGGTAPATDDGTNVAPVTWLSGLYDRGAGHSFDALSHYPYCFPFLAPGEYAEWCAWSQMADTLTSLRSVMSDHNDSDKQIWITEYGAPTSGPRAVAEQTQADWVTQAFAEAAAAPWAGPVFWYTLRDSGQDPDDYFGLRRLDGTKKTSWEAYRESASME